MFVSCSKQGRGRKRNIKEIIKTTIMRYNETLPKIKLNIQYLKIIVNSKNKQHISNKKSCDAQEISKRK